MEEFRSERRREDPSPLAAVLFDYGLIVALDVVIGISRNASRNLIAVDWLAVGAGNLSALR
jgi:hypothetical protein